MLRRDVSFVLGQRFKDTLADKVLTRENYQN